MFENIRHDRARYERGAGEAGFWIMAVYRLGNWASGLGNPLLRKLVWWAYRLARLPLAPFRVVLWAGPRGSRVGRGLVLIHPNDVLIGPGCVIGDDCLIFHDVTIGSGPVPGMPKIGNKVDIYVGARILGGITIGDGAMIGANCVVTRDIPAGSVVLSAPCKVIPRSMSPFAHASDKVHAAESAGIPAGAAQPAGPAPSEA